ncbi:MAG: translocation/assembly module TamB domain-containing protein [Acidobacteriota bacterium]|nr:translocation/assembly module TamB domain-containing protein [Acidobacteriota bacterium]
MRGTSLRRVLLAVGIGIATLLVVAGGLAGWVVSTHAGARWAVARAGVLLKGSFDVDSVEGVIRGPLILHGLTYKTATLTARVDTVRVEWRLSRLLRKQLDITRLTADGVHIQTRTPAEKDARNKLPDLHLPVSVVIRSASIRRIDVVRPGGSPPLRLDSIDLATSAIGDVVRVDRLAIAAPTFAAHASGQVEPQGSYPVQLKLEWWMQPAGSPRYAGAGTFDGTLEKLGVRHDLTAPFSAHVDGTLTAPLSDLAFDAKVSFSGLKTRDFQPDAPAAELSGSLRVTGVPDRFSTRGAIDANVAAGDLGRVHADLDVSRAGVQWNVASLALRFAGTPSELTARGIVRLVEPGPQADLSLAWRRISWPLRGKPVTTSPSGRATIVGTLNAYEMSLDAEIVGPGLPPGRWRLAGHGNRAGMSLSSYEGALLEGTIAGSGRFGWSPQLSWDLSVKGDGLNPAALAPQYPGRLHFEAQAAGRMTPSGPAGEVALAALAGTLRGQPLRGSGRIELQGKTIVLRDASLTVATAHAQASGSIGPSWDLHWKIDAPDVGPLIPDASGSLQASGTLSGPRAAPRVRATAAGRSLVLGPRKAARVEIDADLDLSPGGRMRADVSAGGLVAGTGWRPIDSLTIHGRGTRASHTLALDAKTGEDTLSMSAAGGIAGSIWRGRLEKLDLQARQAGRWRLASAAPLTVSPGEVSLHDFCWASGGAQLCAAADWKKTGASTAEATLRDLPLSLFAPWLPPGVDISGGLNGNVTAELASDGRVLANGALTAGPGAIRYLSAPREPVSVAYRDARVEFRADASGASAAVAAKFVDIGQISGNIRLPSYNLRGVADRNQPLAGRLQMDLRDIGSVQAFVTAAEGIGGSLHADLAIAGTLSDPRLKGEMRLAGGSANLPEYGLELRDLTLAVSGTGTGPLAVDGSVRAAAGGRLTVQGQVPLVPGPSAPLHLTIAGDRFAVLNTYKRRLTISPRLEVGYDGKTVRVTGDVTVPEGRIEYAQKFATIQTSPDVVFVGGAPAPPSGTAKFPFAVAARVRLVLGDAVSLKALGFDGRLRGSLLLIEQPGSPPSATGQISIVSGTYKAYGQDLTVEHGYIRYAGGPIDNPGLDVKAYRKASDGTVAGVIVKGTARRPETTVYSDPPMAQSEALAYLLLGHPLGQATAREGSLVASAATSLGIAGGNLLGKAIASRFGLETARIETRGGGLERAALVVGKYLSPRFYIEYGIGVFDQVSTLRVSYILSKKWTIRAETSGEGNSADVLYTIESGRGGSKQTAVGSDKPAVPANQQPPSSERMP